MMNQRVQSMRMNTLTKVDQKNKNLRWISKRESTPFLSSLGLNPTQTNVIWESSTLEDPG